MAIPLGPTDVLARRMTANLDEELAAMVVANLVAQAPNSHELAEALCAYEELRMSRHRRELEAARTPRRWWQRG